MDISYNTKETSAAQTGAAVADKTLAKQSGNGGFTGKILIISAPSGAGKRGIIQKILECHPELHYSVSATTRPPRSGEVDGQDYYFISREQFEQKMNENEFLEYNTYNGEYYGTPRTPIENALRAGKTVLLEIEVNGARTIRTLYPVACSLFIKTESYEHLREHLLGRAQTAEERAEIDARLKIAKEELKEMSEYDFIITNIQGKPHIAANIAAAILDNILKD
ncbi:MAG: guanylate kinase [Oscillospiraceae bacterium]|jgi:guanylate kinase|nr:guanylate kinase [Oscillospiraceae bacterium]